MAEEVDSGRTDAGRGEGRGAVLPAPGGPALGRDPTAAAPRLALAAELAALYARLPEVEGVAISGSAVSGLADAASDLDLYVYVTAEPPLAPRLAIASSRASRPEVGNRFFEPGDEWVERGSGTPVDVMFRPTGWIEERLAAVLDRHEASTGYTTCLWHSVAAARALFDRSGFLARLEETAARAYPEKLRRAIVAKNHPLLRGKLSSYVDQLELSLRRDDAVSVNHRLSALLASVFDVLFALNRVTHPGEKRLLALAEERCPLRPPELGASVRSLLSLGGRGEPGTLPAVRSLLDSLDGLLEQEGLLP